MNLDLWLSIFRDSVRVWFESESKTRLWLQLPYPMKSCFLHIFSFEKLLSFQQMVVHSLVYVFKIQQTFKLRSTRRNFCLHLYTLQEADSLNSLLFISVSKCISTLITYMSLSLLLSAFISLSGLPNWPWVHSAYFKDLEIAWMPWTGLVLLMFEARVCCPVSCADLRKPLSLRLRLLPDQ